MHWRTVVIPDPGSPDFLNLPEKIKTILRLDKPDLIVTLDIGGVDEPVLSVEITTTTPQSQHAKQRMPRIVAAAECNIPAIYVIPGRKKSGGSTYSLGPDLYFCMDRIHRINNVPVFIYKYPDNNGSLQHDRTYPNQPLLIGADIVKMFRTIDEIIKNKQAGHSVSQLANNHWISQELTSQAAIGRTANVTVSNYSTLAEIDTANLSSYLMRNTNMGRARIIQTIARLPNRIKNRDKTLIFKPAGRMFAHAGDPYCGMLAFFDYAFCRTGGGVEDRCKNLVYMPMNEGIRNITDEFAPSGYNKYWRKCSFNKSGVPSLNDQFKISHLLQYGCVFTKMKPLRIYGYFSDMIIFQDSILVF